MRILLSGGGTGGHIYPALSIAAELQRLQPDLSLVYVGTSSGLEAQIVPKTGIPFRVVRAQGIIGKSAWQKLTASAMLALGSMQALSIVASFRPDVIVGTGGYVSGPVLAAGALLRRRMVLQEQNLQPGVTNRMLARFVDLVALPHAEAAKGFPTVSRMQVFGNPVRKEILSAKRGEGRSQLGLPSEGTVILIYFGSRGSATLHRIVPEALTRLDPSVHVLYVTGDAHYDAVQQRLADLGISSGNSGHIRVYPYLDQMPAALAASDLVIGRAGAMALAEWTARGVPAILVPSPYVAHHHQERNASLLARVGAAEVLAEDGLTADLLASTVESLLKDPARLERMSAASRSLGQPDAAERLAKAILRIAAGAEGE